MEADVAMKRVAKRCAIMGIEDITMKSAAVKRNIATRKEDAKRSVRKKDADVKARDIGETTEVMKVDTMRRHMEEAIMATEEVMATIIMATEAMMVMAVMAIIEVMIINIA